RTQIGRNGWMRQAGERAAVGFRNQRVALRESLDVHLIKNGPRPRRLRLAGSSPRKRRIDDPAFEHEGRTVALVVGLVLVGMIKLIAEQLRRPFQLTDELLG